MTKDLALGPVAPGGTNLYNIETGDRLMKLITFIALVLVSFHLHAGQSYEQKFVGEMNRDNPSPAFLKSLADQKGVDSKELLFHIEKTVRYLKRHQVKFELAGPYVIVDMQKKFVGMLRVNSSDPFQIIVNDKEFFKVVPKEILQSFKRTASVTPSNFLRDYFSILVNEAHAQSDTTNPFPQNGDLKFWELADNVMKSVQYLFGLGGYGQYGQRQTLNVASHASHLKRLFPNHEFQCSPYKDYGAIIRARDPKSKNTTYMLKKDETIKGDRMIAVRQPEGDSTKHYGYEYILRELPPEEAVRLGKAKQGPQPHGIRFSWQQELKQTASGLYDEALLKKGAELTREDQSNDFPNYIHEEARIRYRFLLMKAFAICCQGARCRADLESEGIEVKLLIDKPETESNKPLTAVEAGARADVPTVEEKTKAPPPAAD